MRFGLDISQHQLTWDEIVRRARYAEEAGFDGAWVFDHFKALYGDPTGPCFEAWTLLAALAATTERIRLGVLVTGVTYRHPSILATEAVTVDHVSGGRLEFAIGAAWYEQEHTELGVPFPGPRERIERLDEALQLTKLLWTTDGATFSGAHYELKDATYRPRPIQQPHPPIWIGGGGERGMLPLVARHADVWHGFGNVADLTRKSQAIDRHAEEAGRDPATIARSTALSLSEPWDSVRRRIEELSEAGFSYLTVGWPSEGQERMDTFVSEILPAFSG
ncbi:MAG TPA: TIGR03560 family F420-dependent LLM class oxidoreductase [Actinomycetota bacterium]|nr:TIGR03560 family F420-dependent LLM class oxidoreductase [Actinomycetota bacterium]